MKGRVENLKNIQKGEVRNPNGRPKGSKNFKTLAKNILSQTIRVKDPITNEIQDVVIKELIVSKQIQKAIKGDNNSFEIIVKLVNEQTNDSNIKINIVTDLDNADNDTDIAQVPQPPNQ